MGGSPSRPHSPQAPCVNLSSTSKVPQNFQKVANPQLLSHQGPNRSARSSPVTLDEKNEECSKLNIKPPFIKPSFRSRNVPMKSSVPSSLVTDSEAKSSSQPDNFNTTTKISLKQPQKKYPEISEKTKVNYNNTIKKIEISTKKDLPDNTTKIVPMSDTEYANYEKFKKMQLMETKEVNNDNKLLANFSNLTSEVDKLIADHSDFSDASKSIDTGHSLKNPFSNEQLIEFEDDDTFGLKQMPATTHTNYNADIAALETFLRSNPAEVSKPLNSTGAIPKRGQPFNRRGRHQSHQGNREFHNTAGQGQFEGQAPLADKKNMYRGGKIYFSRVRGGHLQNSENNCKNTEIVATLEASVETPVSPEGKLDEKNVITTKQKNKYPKKRLKQKQSLDSENVSDSSSIAETAESTSQSVNISGNKCSKSTKKVFNKVPHEVAGAMRLLNNSKVEQTIEQVYQNSQYLTAATTTDRNELKQIMKTPVIGPNEIFDILPLRWRSAHYSRDQILKDGFLRYELDPTQNQEYLIYRDLFHHTIPASEHKIKSIQKIENPFLFLMYELKKIEVSKLVETEEKMLFHGTNNRYVNNICVSGLGWRWVKPKKEKETGQGITFTRSGKLASRYCRTDPGLPKFMLLAKVLLFNTKLNQSIKEFPPKDSYFTFEAGNSNLVYDDYLCYPSIFINF